MAVTVGGVGFNVARGLQALGSTVALATFVGDDEPGRLIREVLAGHALAGAGVLPAAASAVSGVLVDPDGRRQVNTDLKDLPDAVYPPEVFARLLDGARLAAISTIGFARPLLPVALGRGVPVAVDLQAATGVEDGYLQDWMHAAEVLFCSDERFAVPAERWAQAVLDRFRADVVVVGRGARGCLLARRGRPPRAIPPRAPHGVVDTTGAGDALFAAFLHYLPALEDAEAAIERAVLVAGLTVGTRGAGPYPTMADVEVASAVANSDGTRSI